MEEFYPFFLALFAGVFFSILSRRIHVPWVIALILGGIVLGPNAFGLLETNQTIEFLGQVGLIFLMFMAGLETKLSDEHAFQGKLLLLAFVNGAVPFVAGFGISWLLGYELLTSLILGVVFTSSSIAVVIPALEQHEILKTNLGQSVVITTVLQDVTSLIALSIILQNISPVTELSLHIFYPLVIVVLFLLKISIPRIRLFFMQAIKDAPDLFQLEFRSMFLILIGTVIVFELLGLHPIIAGFFSGLMLAGSIHDTKLKEKIHTISYGIFIPTFFIVMGLQTDLGVLTTTHDAWYVVLLVVFGSIVSKFASGWLGGKLVGFSRDESLLFAATSVPQLTTTLATAFTAFSFGLIDQTILTALVALSVVSVMTSPILMNAFSSRIQRSVKKHG
jgi:Kef-type K+ transport system membrane component KefB